MQIRPNTTDRKKTVKVIEEVLGRKAEYLGPPTFAYKIGEATVNREGIVECAGFGSEIYDALLEKGLLDNEEGTALSIRVPIDDFDARQYMNLINLVYSKQKLLNAATGTDGFYISENIVEVLRENRPETAEYITEFISRAGEEVRGISFEDGCVFFTGFCIPEDGITAYASVAAMMVSHARNHKSIHAKLVEVENEKYAMRIWLNQMGLTGKGSKEVREFMTRNLKGDCAFRTEESRERWKNARAKKS